MEEAERERLLKHKERLEDDLLKVRALALEEVSPEGNGSGPGSTLAEINQKAVTLSRQLMDVSARAQAFEVQTPFRSGTSRKPSRAWRPFGMTCFPWSATG